MTSLSPFLFALAVGLQTSTLAATAYVQPADQFAAALANRSTSHSFILITAIDNRTNQSRTGCIPAPFLIGAIEKEKGLTWSLQADSKAREIALSRPDHVYRFSNPEALANLAFDNDGGRYMLACQIIRAGHPAFMADRTGAIREGQP